MKKLFTAILILSSLFSFAQKERTLKKVMELQMPEGPGARAANVAFHPTLKRYYACMGGNAIHAMGIYDQAGKKLSPDTLKTLFDVRGFWWSPQLKTFCANGYSDYGWVKYNLDKKGTPVSVTEIFGGTHQPEDNSVGAFDAKKNSLYFLTGQIIFTFSLNTGESDDTEIRLFVGSADKDEALDNEYFYDDDLLDENYNPALIFTAKPGAEFGLLNYAEKRIELYNRQTGYITEKLILPEDAPTDEMLCFSFANGIYWIFDREARIWIGYK